LDSLSRLIGKVSDGRLFLASLAGLTVVFAVLFATKPTVTSSNDSILYSNPSVAKAVFGVFSPMMADILWLKSTHIGEIDKTSYEVDSGEFYRAFLSIGTLDPNFFAAISYGTMYLASVANNPDKALAIINAALRRTDDDRLKFLKLNILHTYKNDHAGSVKLARELLSSEHKLSLISYGFSYDYLVSLIAFEATNKDKKAMIIEDLKILEKKSKNKAQQAAIKAKLDALL